MWHAFGQLYFKRQSDGGMRIARTTDGQPPNNENLVYESILDLDELAGLMMNMSRQQPSEARFQEARTFLDFTP